MDQSYAAPETQLAFLEQLRAQTTKAHIKLEALPISQAIISPKITKFQYGCYLNIMHNVVSDIETNLFPFISDVITDVSERRKAQMVQADLDAIGFPAVQRHTAFNTQFDLAFALGIIYVIEGSSLGGRVIVKNVERSLGYDGQRGAQYFSGYGNVTGSRWKLFLDRLTQYEKNQGGADAIIAGANFAFDVIYEQLSIFCDEN